MAAVAYVVLSVYALLQADDVDVYEALDEPLTVGRWLQGLNLSQYAATFQESGWDHVKFLYNMSLQDLLDLRVTNEQHQARILQSIQSMKATHDGK